MTAIISSVITLFSFSGVFISLATNNAEVFFTTAIIQVSLHQLHPFNK
jgi:hypothetical protein